MVKLESIDSSEDWEKLFNSEDAICHYTSIENGMDILSSGKIKLSPFKDANDPFEFLDKPFIGNQGDINIHMDSRSVGSFHINDDIKHRVKFLSFCTNYDSKVICGETGSERTEKSIYKCYGKPRMWAQYGRNHSGLCLIFSKKKLEELIANKNIVSGFTVYYESEINDYPPLDLRKSYHIEYVSEYISNNIQSIFYKKTADFVDENEYRIVTYCDSGEDVTLPIKDIIIGVIRGSKIESVDQVNSFKRACEANNTYPFYLHWENGKFNAEIEFEFMRKWPYKRASITRKFP
jgi:hypothetical protein